MADIETTYNFDDTVLSDKISSLAVWEVEWETLHYLNQFLK